MKHRKYCTQKDDTVLTSGDVAKMFHVSASLVNVWANKGMIPCRRVPSSQDRRFLRKDVLAFAKKYEVPIERLEQ